MNRQRHFARAIGWMTLLFITTCCAAADAPLIVRTWISPERVARALAEAGVSVSTSQIELLSQVPTNNPESGLQLVSIGRFTEDLRRAKLRCIDASACIPFYVVLHDVPLNTVVANRSEAGNTGRSRAALSDSSSEPDVLRGDRAILVLEKRDSRIKLQVICLQNGRSGESIRVSSADRKRFYQGKVVRAGLLKGTP